jgi:hypothetical protein
MNFVVGFATLLLLGCTRVTKERLIGTWRAEVDEGVTEMAFRGDGTYTEWSQSKTVLHTPGVIVESGAWNLTGRELEMNPKTTNSVEVGDPTKLTIDWLGDTKLVWKTSTGTSHISARRLNLPQCSGRVVPSAISIEETIVGTWRVHYRTHDYQEDYKSDKSLTISAQIGREMKTIHMAHGVSMEPICSLILRVEGITSAR